MYGSRRYRDGYSHPRQARQDRQARHEGRQARHEDRQARHEEPPYTVEDPDGNPIPVDFSEGQNREDTGRRSDDQRPRRESEGRPTTPNQEGPRQRRTRRDSNRRTYRRDSFDDAHTAYERHYYPNEASPNYASYSGRRDYPYYESDYDISDSENYPRFRQGRRENRYEYPRRRHNVPKYEGPSPRRGMRDDGSYQGFDDRYSYYPGPRNRASDEYEDFRHGTRDHVRYDAPRDQHSRQRPERGGRVDSRGFDDSDLKDFAEYYDHSGRRYVYRAYRCEHN